MNILKHYEKKALNGREMLQLVKGCANLLTYPQLVEYDNIDDALGPNGAIILLYETRKHFGHWVCIFKRDDNTIEHFDSYGLKPDDELEKIPMNFRLINNSYYPHLTALLFKSGYDIEYNDYRLQRHIKDVNTCGRHVACRLNFRYMDIDDYFDMIKSTDLHPDMFVTLMTLYI
jgi:hypothetical protein